MTVITQRRNLLLTSLRINFITTKSSHENASLASIAYAQNQHKTVNDFTLIKKDNGNEK